MPSGGKKKKERGGPIVCNLQHCCYPIVRRVGSWLLCPVREMSATHTECLEWAFQAVEERGWVIAKRGESYDVAISDNNHAVKVWCHNTRLCCRVLILPI